MGDKTLNLSVVLGGEKLAVQLLDGSTTEVSVRYLPVALYPEFSTALDDEIHQAALFTGLPRATVESFHPASHDEIMRKGHELNLDFFESWVSRRKVALRAADPNAETRMINLVEAVVRDALAAPLLDAQKAVAAARTASASHESSPASGPSQASPASC